MCAEPGGKFVLALAVFNYLQQGPEEEEGSCFPRREGLGEEGGVGFSREEAGSMEMVSGGVEPGRSQGRWHWGAQWLWVVGRGVGQPQDPSW